MRIKWLVISSVGLTLLLSMSATLARSSIPKVDASGQSDQASASSSNPDDRVRDNASTMIAEGRRTFRFDTFGDEAFWGDTLQLHKAIEGANLGGVGPGVSPRTALAVGLKVDVDALPASLIEQLKAGQVNLEDPATTLALLKLNAVMGVKGFFNRQGGWFVRCVPRRLPIGGIRRPAKPATRTIARRRPRTPFPPR